MQFGSESATLREWTRGNLGDRRRAPMVVARQAWLVPVQQSLCVQTVQILERICGKFLCSPYAMPSSSAWTSNLTPQYRKG